LVAAAVVIVALGIALYVRWFAVPAPVAREPHAGRAEGVVSEPSVEQADLAEASAPPAEGRPEGPDKSVRSAALAAEASAVDPDEQALLRMYDEMADAAEMSADDCDAIEYAFSTAIEGGTPHLKRVIQRAKARQAQDRDAGDPLLAVMKERLLRLFATLRKLPPACGRQLSGELRRLSEGKF
jgi:hypothetical protein